MFDGIIVFDRQDELLEPIDGDYYVLRITPLLGTVPVVGGIIYIFGLVINGHITTIDEH